jgi:hypothetical protein
MRMALSCRARAGQASLVGQTIALRGLSPRKTTMAFQRGLGDRRQNAIVCPTGRLAAMIETPQEG